VYATKSDVGENTPNQSNSSLRNKSADDCWLLLRAMHEVRSDIDYESFVIIDDRKLQDDTVLVEGDIGEDLIKSQRHADGVLRATDGQLRAEEEEGLYGPFGE
jgi:hypothetical protein